MVAGVEDQYTAQTGYLLGAWLVSAAMHVYIIAPASVLSQVSAGVGVPETTGVWLVSAVLVAWAATNFGVGVVIDRAGDRTVVAAGAGVVFLAGIVGWFAASDGAFWPLVGTRVVAGVAVGAIWIASTTLVGRLYDAARRGTALGIFTTSAPAGFALGQVSGPVVADAAGWAAIFPVGGALTGLAFAVFAAVHLRAAGDGTPGGPGADEAAEPGATPSVRENFGTVLRNRRVLVGGGLAFVAYSLYLFLNSWLPTYLVERFAVSLAVSGLLAAVFPAMGVVSRAGGGVISDRVFTHRRLPVLKLSFVLAAPVMVLLSVSRSIAVLMALLVVGGLVIQLTFGVVYSYVQEGVDEAVAGTALAFLGSAGISGAFSAPVVAGTLIDLTGGYAAAFGYAVALSVAGVVLVFVASEQ